MTISASVAAFIAGQRELLFRLEQFAETPAYRRLLTVAAPMVDGDETWLAEWLIQPAFTLRELPIDTLTRPGGQERAAGLDRRLRRRIGTSKIAASSRVAT